ncbi:MDR family MFS transporter [Streptococcus caprae]|uniref:MDR family MFS transporter n=1 Tax=Streptococcus caprae TaxID=1640501 RepID=A0ABV8CTJ3_9STRE
MNEFFSLPKQIQLGEAMRFLSIMIGSAVLPFMSMYYVSYFGTFWTGILIVVTQVAGFIASLYGGHLSDALGRKTVIKQGYLLSAVGWLVAIIANVPGHPLPWITFIGVFMVNIGSNYFSPAFDAMVIDMTDETNRRFVYTIGYWLINIAVMLGAGIAGLFYDQFFFELLIALLIVEMLCYAVVIAKFGETKPEHVEFDHGHGIFDSFRNYGEVLSDKAFLTYTLGIILYGAIWAQVDNYLAVHLKLHFVPAVIFGQTITGAKMLSSAVFINTVMIVLLMTTINRLTKSFKLAPQLILGGGLFVVGMMLAFVFNQFVPIALTVVIYTFGEMIYVPASQVLRADMMDEAKVGSYSGLVSMAGPVGNIIAGTMVSLSHFTGIIGVEITLILLAVCGIGMMIRAAQMKQLEI